MLFEKMIVEVYKKNIYVRCDDNGTAYYFSAEDFNGLEKTPYSFVSSKGYKLKGYFYAYPESIKGKLVVFDHGFGGGHRSYMKEIEMLCRKGYSVFSYDHTGCMESEGENTGGLGQSLCDLNDCLASLKKDGYFKNNEVYVIGHSWGGFSTMNITAYHPEVSRVVVISGFVSVDRMINSFFGNFLSKFYRKPIAELEHNSNPVFATADGVETLRNTNSKVLLVYSDNDPLVKKSESYDVLYNELKNRENISFHLETNKWHNPNYTEDAVKYKDSYVALAVKKTKKKELETPEQKKAFVESFDWKRMTVQDERVWNIIFDFLA